MNYLKKSNYKVTATSVSVDDFNQKLIEVDGRAIHLREPDMKYEYISNDIWVFEDNRKNYHLLFKEVNSKIVHLKLDPWTGIADEDKGDKNAGRKAIRKIHSLAKKYNEIIDSPVNNSEYSWEYQDYHNTEYAYSWIDDVHVYDMNSCYPNYFKYPMPYGKIIAENSVVKEGEIGFDIIINVHMKKVLKPKFEGEQADIIFKTKKFKCLAEYADFMFELKRHYNQLGDIKNYNRVKISLNALHGMFKYYNVYISAAVIGYAFRDINKYKNEDTLIVHCDAIFYKGNKDYLFNIGEEMGQFKKDEHNGQSLFYKTESDYKWSDGTIKKKGEKIARRGKNKIYYFNTETRRIERKWDEQKENTQ